MGKSSGSNSTPTTQNVVQTSIPAELMPYATDILNQGEALANQPYVNYPGQQLANQSSATTQAYGQAGQLGSVGTGSTNQAASTFNSGLQSAAQATANGPQQYTAPTAAGVQQVGSNSWTNPGVAQNYMSPYINTALAGQIGQANQDYAAQSNVAQGQAIQAGAFGGDQAALAQESSQRDYNNSINNMVATGLNTAYTTGQSAYQADNSANLLAQEANQQSAQNTQNTNVQAGLTTNALNSGNINQYNSNLLNQASLSNTIGNSQAQLGQTQQNMASTGLNALYAAGQSQQNYQQQGLDIGYNNFVNQQQYPEQQLNYLSGLLHGFNVSPNSYSTTQSTYQNPVSQLVGGATGITGLVSALGSATGSTGG